MKTNKAILINSITHEVTEVEVGQYTDIYSFIDCDCFDCVSLSRGETIYVDDNGLLFGCDKGFVSFDGYPQPLAGHCLILGTDSEGESVDTKLTVEDVKSLISFESLEEVRNRFGG